MIRNAIADLVLLVAGYMLIGLLVLPASAFLWAALCAVAGTTPHPAP